MSTSVNLRKHCSCGRGGGKNTAVQRLWRGYVDGADGTVASRRVETPEQEAYKTLQVRGKETGQPWISTERDGRQVALVALVLESCSREVKASCPNCQSFYFFSVRVWPAEPSSTLVGSGLE